MPWRAAAHHKALSKFIYYDTNRELIVVNIDHNYEIAVSQCTTYEQILSWMLQLSEKPWSNKEHLEFFARLAIQTAGLDWPRNE